jgi:hypothetical protein
VARIDVMNTSGAVLNTYTLPAPSGEMQVAVPANIGRLVTYRLVATRGAQSATYPLAISIQCALPWFFGDTFAPQDATCPLSVGAIAAGQFQPFERGVMIYVSANNLNTIYVLQNDGFLYSAFTSGWDGSTLNETEAPGGYYRPEQMFNWAYYNTNGGWNSQLGWATTQIQGGERTIQYDQNGSFYVDVPGGGLYRFSGGNNGSWRKIR